LCASKIASLVVQLHSNCFETSFAFTCVPAGYSGGRFISSVENDFFYDQYRYALLERSKHFLQQVDGGGGDPGIDTSRSPPVPDGSRRLSDDHKKMGRRSVPFNFSV
jgi:hypothetical protein